MTLMLDGNSEHVAHAWKKIDLSGEKKIRFVTALNYNQMPYTDQITEIALYVRTHFSVMHLL